MKLFKRIILSVIALFFIANLTGCSEKDFARVAVPEYVDGVSLILTSSAQGSQSVSKYIYFDDFKASDGKTAEENYIANVVNKLCLTKGDCQAAYVEVSFLNDFIKAFDTKQAELHSKAEERDKLCIIFVDGYNSDGSIKSVWVAKESWINDAPKYYKRFVKGLANANDYRAKNCDFKLRDSEGNVTQSFTNYSELHNYMVTAGVDTESFLYKLLNFFRMKYTSYNTADYSDIYAYCSIFAIQNEYSSSNIQGIKFESFAASDKVTAKYKTMQETYDLYIEETNKLNSYKEFVYVKDENEDAKKDENGNKIIAKSPLQIFEEKKDDDGNLVYDAFDEKGNKVDKPKSNKTYTYKQVFKFVRYDMKSEGYELLDDVLDTLVDDNREFYDIVKMDKVLEGINEVMNPDDPLAPDYTKAIIVGIALVLVVGGTIFLLIRRRIKTGKKLFDIKKALDVDIESNLE